MVFRETLPSGTPVLLAPMAGVTDAPFRKIVMDFGATAVVSEMVSSEALIRSSKKTYRRLVDKGDNVLKIVQIVGANPQNMAESAVINEGFGADVIDINMGCPARKIVSNESGSALMKNEDLAVRIAEAVVNAVRVPVTLKMRLGWDNENINFMSLAKKFEEVGVQMLSIHCRTRSQMYGGKADWLKIKELRSVIKIPYLCNGDIKSGEDAETALRDSDAHGVMIGRGALGRPWLLNQVIRFLDDKKNIPTPSIEAQYRVVMEHFRSVLDFYGKIHGIRVFRKHFCWYSNGLSGSSNFRETISRAEDLCFIEKHVEEFYEKNFKAAL